MIAKTDRRPRVMLVFAATSYRPDAFVAAAARRGVDLVLASDLSVVAARFGCPCVQVDFADPRTHEHFELDRPIDGVIAMDEPSAVVAARFADTPMCRRRFHAVDGVTAVSDKGRMRAQLEQAVPAPRVLARVRPGEPLPAVSFPCVVKPPRASGSQGVIRANDAGELARAVTRCRQILHRHPRAVAADEGFFTLLVEEYVDGEEVAVEGLMVDGRLTPITIFDKPEPLTGPFFEETIYATPSTHTQATQQALYEITEQAARALGLCDGPIHAELRVGPDGPMFIEIAARSIGGLCSRALVHVVGSLEEMLLCHAAGLALPARPVTPVASGVMMIPVPTSGVLRAVGGVAAAGETRGVDAVTISITPGEIVRAPPDGGSYLGFMFAHGDDPAASLRAAHAKLRFEIAPLLPTVV